MEQMAQWLARSLARDTKDVEGGSEVARSHVAERHRWAGVSTVTNVPSGSFQENVAPALFCV